MKISSRTSRLSLRAWVTLAITSGAIMAGHAAEDPSASSPTNRFLPWDKGSITIGAFVTTFDSTVKFGLNNNPGVKVNGENLLGLDSSLTVFRADALYRPGESRRNQLDISYGAYHRNGYASLTESITIGGVTLPVGANIQTVFNFDIIRGTYSYAFLQNDRVRLAFGLGIYAVPLQFSIDAQTTGGRQFIEGADTTLPLPALSLQAEFQVVPKVFLNASVNGMYLAVSDFSGSLVDVNAGLEYRPWKHIGLGVGYNYMRVDVEASSSNSSYPGANFIGSVNVQFSGLLLYGKVTF